MKNSRELREHLCEVFEELRAKKISAEEAREVANVAGKILGSVKVEIAYAQLLEIKPAISFLK